MKIRKHQGGAGIMPLIYTPLQSPSTGAATTAAPATSSQKQNILNDSTIKDLYSKALPSDLEAFVNKSNIFGNSLFTSGAGFENTERDLKSLLLYMNKMAFEKDTYSEAMKRIDKIEGSSEIAISPNNGIFVIRDKKLKEIAYTDIKEGEYALTNAQLALIRAHNSGAAFDTNMTQALTNATSMKEIHSVIDRSLSGLGYDKSGNTEFGLFDGMDDITLDDLRSMGYNELIKSKSKIGSNNRQIQSAVISIYKQLTPAQKTLLGYRAQEIGSKDIPSLILEYIVSRNKNEYSISEDLNKAGKGSKSGSGEKDPMADLPYNEALQLITGRGFNQPVSFHEGTQAQITTCGTHSLLTSKTGESVGQKAATHMLDSSLAGVLDFTNISIAGAKIDQEGLNRVMIRDANAIGVDMPFTVTEDGTIIPDINLTKKVQEIEQYIRENNITDITQINKLYIDSKLPVKFIGIDGMGNPILNTTSYRRFVGLNVIADRSAFDDDLVIDLNRSLKRVKSDVRLKDFQNVMRETSYDDKFKYTDPWVFWEDPEVYEGVLWTPLKTNALQAYLGAEENITVSEAESIERAEQEKQIIASAPSRYKTINQADYGI